jgi:methylated-DNA-[protein]-cysteine S-methyltransferase
VVRYTHVDSPIGRLLLVGRPGALTGLYVADHESCRRPESDWVEDEAPFEAVAAQLAEYFDGRRTEFDVVLEPSGTPFQLAVWSVLAEIPFGATMGYGEVARRIGRPTASRAVGAANGRNPISILLPCHRVIGADGSLTGYGWGTARKSWLLDHERAQATLFG